MQQADEIRELEELGIAHPSPHRRRFSLTVLVLPLFVPPVLWAAQLAARYALIATACFPRHAPRLETLPHDNASWLAAVGVAVFSMAVMTLLGILALRIWRGVGGENNQPRGALLDIGEGRTSFMAHWGIFVSFGFLLVTVFDAMPLVFVPLCGD